MCKTLLYEKAAHKLKVKLTADWLPRLKMSEPLAP